MKYLLFFILFLLLSCTDKKNKLILEESRVDSLDFYLKKYHSADTSNKLKIKYLEKSFQVLKKLDNSSKNRDTLFKVSYEFYSNQEWNNFEEVSNYLIGSAKEAKDTLNIANVYRFKANYFKRTEVYDSAFYYYVKSEKLYLKLGDNINYANILFNKGIVQYKVNDFLGAELSLSKAYYMLKNTKEYENKEYEKLYGILNQLGLACIELKEYDRAINYLEEALLVIRKNNLRTRENEEAVCLSNIGYAFFSQSKYSDAIKFYKDALKNTSIKIENPILYSNIIDNLAYCNMNINVYDKIPALFYESLRIRDSLKIIDLSILSNVHLSEYYYKKEDVVAAKKYFKQSMALAIKSKNAVDLMVSLKQGSLVDKLNASKYTEEYIRISDSLQIAERNSKDRFARIQLETDELRQENFNLEEKNRNILNYFFGTVVFIGVLFFVRNQRSRARLLALKQAQQQANEEIYRLIISHQNQLELGKDLEKKRLSKELHDGVLGRLFGLRLSLDGLNSFDDEQAKKERLEYLNELQLIEQDLREISHELNRETSLLINNFVAIINSLIEQQAKVNNANIKVIISEKIDWDKISNIIKINLYRILQEALQNINKHAGAKNVLVHFRKDTEENLLFNIEDDGKGFDTNIKKNKGIGTKNMVSRVHQCNGSIDIKSEIGKGSKIIIIFPLENSNFKV